jgi:ribosomal-protein-alanine N-acetyltransferase
MKPAPLTETMLIRPMRPEDLAQVQAIDQACFSLPWPASAFEYELYHNQLSLLYVAEARSETGEAWVVGMVVIWMVLDEAHIATLAVQNEYRRQGIARQLLAVALEEAQRRGAIQATLEVRAGNQAAQDLYRKLGFDIVGLRPRYYRDNHEDALIMTALSLNIT